MSEATIPGRDSHGRLLPGHRLGGRPRGKRSASPVSTALEAAGKSIEGAQKALVESTIAALNAEDPAERSAARRLLASWLFPKARAVDLDLFRGTRTAEERLARVVAAMGVGGMTPEEAVTASKAVEALSRAGEWERLAAAQEAAVRSAGNGPALPVGPDAGPSNEAVKP